MPCLSNGHGFAGNAFFGAIVSLWTACCFYFLPRVLSLGFWPFDPAKAVCAVSLCLFFALFWLYALYHAILVFLTFIGTFLSETRSVSGLASVTDGPAVAILYTTMNDFDPIAVNSCLQQDYRNCRVFVLDDTTDPGIRAQVDQFRQSAPVELVRRDDRSGFKAGNLNHTLATVASAYPLFAIVDADCVLPRDFISRLVPELMIDSQIAFIQAACQPRADQRSFLARAVTPMLVPMWSIYMPYRNRFGFVPLLGRGALVRRSVWVEIGGMPNIVSEDVGFALAAREAGYRGRYVAEPYCQESLPDTYNAFIRQQTKYTRGAYELLSRYWRTLLLSRNLRWFEKLDCTLMVGGNILPGLFCAFLVLIAVGVPLLFYEARTLYLATAGQTTVVWFALTPGPVFKRVLGWDFYAIYLVSILAPILAALNVDRRPIAERLRLLAWATFLYYSIIPRSLFEGATFALTRRAEFTSTGDRRLMQIENEVSKRAIWWCNVTATVAFGVSAALTFNLYLAAIAVAVFIGAFGASQFQTRAESHANTPGWLLSIVAVIPIVLTALAMILFGSGLLAGQGGSFVIAPFHF